MSLRATERSEANILDEIPSLSLGTSDHFVALLLVMTGLFHDYTLDRDDGVGRDESTVRDDNVAHNDKL